ncbi:MAG: DUF3299 domain-containing protein [Oleiphilaceae bacterium]|nr:DUF3299 domain-containing protein [Oleiphilaceae bacterium]
MQLLTRFVVPFVVVVLAASVLPVAAGKDLRTLDWIELMPASDLALLESLPEVEHEGDGPMSLPDEIMTGRVVPEMDNTAARIPGFIVPLKTVGNQRIVEFFLVPYFGACIHVPPPPPNQIIHVTYPEGIELDVLYDPYWIEGDLTISRTEHDIGTASYAIKAQNVQLYEGE